MKKANIQQELDYLIMTAVDRQKAQEIIDYALKNHQDDGGYYVYVRRRTGDELFFQFTSEEVACKVANHLSKLTVLYFHVLSYNGYDVPKLIRMRYW